MKSASRHREAVAIQKSARMFDRNREEKFLDCFASLAMTRQALYRGAPFLNS
jgi:hypothetical protein